MALRLVFLGCVLWLGGCSGEDDGATSSGAPVECAAGEWRRDDGACVPVGLPPDMPCAPGEWLREADGACIPAGVPPDGCGEGFVHDGDRGCEPILPVDPCPEGVMAVPGETRCRDVAACAPGLFGDIPVEPDTEYVDASHTGTSDGSLAAPWTTIQEGIDAALPGAIVAIAAGDYVEDVQVVDKPVRLWGKCPALVELEGSANGFGALMILPGSSGTEVHRLAVTGQARGVVLSGSGDVLFEELWIHDTTLRGILVQDDFGPTSFIARRVLVERAQERGVFVYAADATIEASSVRDTFPDAEGLAGRGIEARDNIMTAVRSTLTLVRSLVERNRDAGVMVVGSDATVEISVMRDTEPDGLNRFGYGITAELDDETVERANVTVVRSLLERNHSLGSFVEASDLTMEASVVRDASHDGPETGGRGVNAQYNTATGERANMTILRSLLERNQEIGVFVASSDATFEASAVRDNSSNVEGYGGRGISLQVEVMGAPSSIRIVSALIERNREAGVAVKGSDVTVETSVVRDTSPNAQGILGHGIAALHDPNFGGRSSLTLLRSLVERNVEAGVFVMSSDARLEASEIRDTVTSDARLYGDGVVVWSTSSAASASVTATRIERSQRAAVSTFGGAIALGGAHLVCQAFDINAESWEGIAAAIEDRAGVLCGCPDASGSCKAQSAGLAPPPPPE